MPEWEKLVTDTGGQLSGLALFDEGIYSVSTASGEVKIFQETESTLATFASTEGVPNSLAFDSSGVLFVTDLANKCIKSKEPGDNVFQVLVGEYEGKQFHGPNSLCFDREGTLFFTDSGPMGDTSLARAKGSVFCVKLEDQLLKPLALECLAYPSGIAVSADGALIYVAETMTNRVLRFVRRPNGVFYSSVFHTFSGGFGPSALACDSESRLYVACFEFGGIKAGGAELNGRIVVLSPDGKVLSEVEAPGPEVMGLLVYGENLLVTEQVSSSIYSVRIDDLVSG